MPLLKTKQNRIVRDEKVCGGSPRIDGTRIRVSDVVEQYIMLGKSPAEIAIAFRISVSDVHDALSYYYRHANDIDSDIKNDKAFIESFRKKMIKLEISHR